MKENLGYFITGTDTGVGKTHFTCRLIHSLAQRGIKTHPRKPVESGCEATDSGLIPADAMALLQAAGDGDLNQVCAYRLQHALSPERAARLENIHVTIDDLATACLGNINHSGVLLVEGAGGFYSPLALDGLNADLAKQLGLPVILVAADRLGCINHTLLTAQAIAHCGLMLEAVALNLVEAAGTKSMDNAQDLNARLECPVVTCGYDPTGAQTDAGVEHLADLIQHSIERV